MTGAQTIIETKRLVLRKWSNADRNELFEILRDAEVSRNIGDGKPYTPEKTDEFLVWVEKYERENGFCRWAVVEKSSSEIIGSCGFARLCDTHEIDLGYLFARKHWGKGYATEIAEAALEYGFNNLGFREIIALTALDNIASQKVLKKIGFTKRGIEIFGGEENLVFIKKKFDE